MNQLQNTTTNDWLEEYSGKGMDHIFSQNPFLSITQSVNASGIEQGKIPGTWWHTGLNKSLGRSIEVVVVAWEPVYIEKSAMGRTIAIHRTDAGLDEIGTGKNYKLVRHGTNNKVDNTFAVILSVTDEPNSTCLYTPSVKSTPAMRKWRSMISSVRLGTGNRAPIFAKSWILTIATARNESGEFFVLDKATPGSFTPKDYFDLNIAPALADGNTPIALLESMVRVDSAPEEEIDTDLM